MNTVRYSALGLGLLLSLNSLSQARDVEHLWCPPAQAVTVTTPVITPQSERISLAADALFAFNQSTTQDMLPQGKATLDRLAQQLSSGYVRINSLHLTGHTDRLGKEAYNEALGLRRAEAVRAYLQSKGVDAAISVSSAGEREPVTTDCVGTKATTALKACLQPDRRVVVDVLGVRRVTGK